jgi:hypothetical protein
MRINPLLVERAFPVVPPVVMGTSSLLVAFRGDLGVFDRFGTHDDNRRLKYPRYLSRWEEHTTNLRTIIGIAPVDYWRRRYS